MKNKLLFGIILTIVLIAFATAVFYPEPWGNNQDGGGNNLTNIGWISADTFNGSVQGNVSGNMAWSNLTDYPVACPGSSAVTTLNDSVYCSDLWVDVAGDVMTGSLNISGDLNITGNFTGNQIYGEMWMQNESGYSTTAIASSSVWYNLTGFNDTKVVTGQTLNGFTYDNAAEHLTALIAGKYRVIYSVSKGNAGNNQEYEFAVAINSIIQNNTVIHRKLGAAGDVGDTATSGFIDLIVNDNVHIMTRNKDGTADIETHAANINLIRIGD